MFLFQSFFGLAGTDEDYTVSFRDIINTIKDKGIKLTENEQERLHEISNAFENLEDENYDIAFHFPNPDVLQKSDLKDAVYVFEGAEDHEFYEGEYIGKETKPYDRQLMKRWA
jgi:hypothetical protein